MRSAEANGGPGDRGRSLGGRDLGRLLAFPIRLRRWLKPNSDEVFTSGKNAHPWDAEGF